MTVYATLRPDDIVPGTPILTFRLDEGDEDAFLTSVVGKRHYSDAVAAFVGRPDREDPENKDAARTVFLVRDPHNPNDPNAVQVWSAGHGQLGYLPREHAAELAAAIDEAVRSVLASTGRVPAVKVPGEMHATFDVIDFDDDGNEIIVRPTFDDVEIDVTVCSAARLSTAKTAGKPSKFPGVVHQPPPPAGWYPDPTNAAIQRYWDGAAWTEHWAPR